MEDDKSTADSELDTNLDEPDVELEDIEVSEEDMAGLDKDEADEAESEPEVAKPEAESEQPELEAEEPAEEETEQPSDTDQKAHNKMMAEQRIREKQMREAGVKQKQQEYVAEGDDDQSVALRQLQVDAYNNKVENNTNKLTNGYERAVKDFPILSDTTPEIKAEVDAAIDAFQALHVKIDSFGNPSEISGDFYQYLQTKANSIQKLTAIGARNQVNNKNKEKSKTIVTPSRTPKEPKIDLDMAAFEEEAKRW